MGEHIKPYSHLIHDGEKSHGVLIKKLYLTDKVYKTATTKKLADKNNPLYPINHIHALSKKFMREHGGYNRDDLQDRMNLLWFIFTKPNNRYHKIAKFIEMSINSPNLLRYRDTMLKK